MRILNIILAGSIALLSGCQSFDRSISEEHHTQTTPIRSVNLSKEEIKEPNIDIAEVTDVWQRIRQDLSFDIPDQELVKKYRDWYIKHPQHLEIVSQRASPFLYLIVEEVEKRDLPIELALLPIVESAFDPFAYSDAAASGLWQFTSPMAKHFGLQMNWWYDGRRDVPAATIAALDMLEYLYKKTYNNWLYAIAAYNTGEGRVRNAVKNNKRKGKSTEFWALDLPTETQRYVPQLLALADVIQHADEYGIKLTPIENKPKIKVVNVGSQIDLELAANLADITASELHKLNPGYDRWSTAPQGPHKIVLPIDKVANFKLALTDTNPDDRLNWERYRIKSGDSLSLIAQRYRTTPSALRIVNDMTSNTIIAGRHLLIPVAVKAPDLYTQNLVQRVKSKQNMNHASEKIDYIVKSGDSLWKIAKKYNVNTVQLASWNNMAPKDTLSIGQELAMWSGENINSSVTRKVNYTVRSGDSLTYIASKFNVNIKDLVRWNALEKIKYIQPGQKLELYVDLTKVSANSST
ncbi:MAG: LysM peptidoglycan-binding domain-containing protein [Shewanella sp.]